MVKHSSIKNTQAFYTTIDKSKYGSPVTVVCIPENDIQKVSIDMCTQPYLSPEKMLKTYGDQKPYLLCNCNFFATSTGNSIFNLISKGKVYSHDTTIGDKIKWGLGTLANPSENEKHPLYLGEYGTGTDKWYDYSTIYPLLILNNKRQDVSDYSDINYKAQRMSVGLMKADSSLYYCWILVEGNGCKLETLQTIWFNEIGCNGQNLVWVANLDGGGSAALHIEGDRVSESGWQRFVDSVMCVWLNGQDCPYSNSEDNTENEDNNKPTEEKPNDGKTLTEGYRIQIGAFQFVTNARNFCKEIQSLGKGLLDYSQAFVTQDEDGLYKVQVGFLSLNNPSVNDIIEELDRLGYDSFKVKTSVWI